MRLESAEELLSIYSESLQLAKIGVWSWDVQKNALAFDVGILDLYEISDCTKMHTIEDWAQYLAVEKRKSTLEAVHRAVSSEFLIDHQLEIHLPSGQSRFVRIKAKKIKNKKNEVIQLLGVNWDITTEVLRLQEKKALVNKINSMQSLLLQQSKLAVLGQVTAGIAHEVNNPLSIIVGKANLIEQTLLNQQLDHKKINADLASIQKNADRIAKIIRSLNSFSRNSIHDPFQRVSVLKIIDDVFEIMKEKFKSNFIDFIIITDENMNYENKIEVRESEILQVLVNLLTNSYDAVQVLDTKWVKLSITEKVASYQISIMDSGFGVPAEVIPHMMEPFYTTKKLGIGTGLGLSLSLQIIKSHGGNLQYNSLAANTEFIISLKK